MRRFEQVGHLMDDNIFKTFHRLSGEIGIQPNGAPAVIAAAPFRLHSLDEEPLHPDSHQSLPFFDQWWNSRPHQLTMPFFYDCLPLRFGRPPAHTKDHPSVI